MVHAVAVATFRPLSYASLFFISLSSQNQTTLQYLKIFFFLRHFLGEKFLCVNKCENFEHIYSLFWA